MKMSVEKEREVRRMEKVLGWVEGWFDFFFHFKIWEDLANKGCLRKNMKEVKEQATWIPARSIPG